MFYLQLKSDRDDCFQTISVESKEKPTAWQRLGLIFTASGYGSKIPTRHIIKWNNRWYRVYCAIFSNIGSLYIVSKGEKITVIAN